MDWLTVVLLALPTTILLINTSHKFNYVAKFVFLYASYIILSGVICLLLLPRPNHPGNGLLASRILRLVNWPISLRIRVEGEEHLRRPGGAVILLNHQSSVDLMVVMELWPACGTLRPVAKASLKYIGGWFGLAAWLAGCVFINRGTTGSHQDMDRVGEEAKELGEKLLVFPEGTRNSAGDLNMLPFKKGAFHVAVKGELPILPVVISQYDFLDHANMRFLPGEVRVRVLPPIETRGLGKDSLEELVQSTREAMVTTLRSMK